MEFGKALRTEDATARRHRIVDTLTGAFAELMTADPIAFRAKFRKMAADPHEEFRHLPQRPRRARLRRQRLR